MSSFLILTCDTLRAVVRLDENCGLRCPDHTTRICSLKSCSVFSVVRMKESTIQDFPYSLAMLCGALVGVLEEAG